MERRPSIRSHIAKSYHALIRFLLPIYMAIIFLGLHLDYSVAVQWGPYRKPICYLWPTGIKTFIETALTLSQSYLPTYPLDIIEIEQGGFLLKKKVYACVVAHYHILSLALVIV